MNDQRRIRRVVLVTMLVLGLGAGASACGSSDKQGAQKQDVEDLRSRVSTLRLEVETLRKEVTALRSELEGTGGLSTGGTTTTTQPRSPTSTNRS